MHRTAPRLMVEADIDIRRLERAYFSGAENVDPMRLIDLWTRGSGISGDEDRVRVVLRMIEEINSGRKKGRASAKKLADRFSQVVDTIVTDVFADAVRSDMDNILPMLDPDTGSSRYWEGIVSSAAVDGEKGMRSYLSDVGPRPKGEVRVVNSMTLMFPDGTPRAVMQSQADKIAEAVTRRQGTRAQVVLEPNAESSTSRWGDVMAYLVIALNDKMIARLFRPFSGRWSKYPSRRDVDMIVAYEDDELEYDRTVKGRAQYVAKPGILHTYPIMNFVAQTVNIFWPDARANVSKRGNYDYMLTVRLSR